MRFRAALFLVLVLLASASSIGQAQTATASGEPAASPPSKYPSARTITLGDIEYKDAQNWTVWINGQKVTPSVSMKEIVDISVAPDIVHLKWFDIGLNGVFDIQIHSHETYDIATGVMTPAPSASAPSK